VNQLRQLMLEELHRRNFADTTIRTYLHGVAHFSRYFRRPPDQLGPEDIRKYQAMLFTKLKFSPNTVILRLASLRFFYIHVLKRGWSIAETPYPKKVRHLPGVLSQEEVARLIEAADTPFHRILLMTMYATGARRAEAAHLKVSDIDSQRMVVHIRRARAARTAMSCSARSCSKNCALLARTPAQAEGVALSRQPLAHIQPTCDHQGPMECLPDRC
jgi:integrase/recombinase XerD